MVFALHNNNDRTAANRREFIEHCAKNSRYSRGDKGRGCQGEDRITKPSEAH
jgi:hypothetical protein